jgi:16S rRNA (uracil1498-N3)-methyltransferase
VGPEGGLAEQEESLIVRAGAAPSSIGTRNLRTGTAALAAAALLLGWPGEPGIEEGGRGGSR